MNKKIIGGITAVALIALTAVPVFADNGDGSSNPSASAWGHMKGFMHSPQMMPGVIGTVTAVSGNTITVLGHTGFASTTSQTTFTVDATNAQINKNGKASVANIATGDNVFVVGVINGSTVTAKVILDGRIPMHKGEKGENNAINPPITGNGEPVVAGTIASISGSGFTLTNQSKVTYTVDTTNAKIVEGQNTISLSALSVGNAVLVQGAVNGAAITASSVIETNAGGSLQHASSTPFRGGILRGIGSFFKHLFGF